MKIVKTDRVINIDTGIEYYITEVNEIGTFGVRVGSVDFKNTQTKLVGNFKLASIIYGEYDSLEDIEDRKKRAKEVIKLT